MHSDAHFLQYIIHHIAHLLLYPMVYRWIDEPARRVADGDWRATKIFSTWGLNAPIKIDFWLLMILSDRRVGLSIRRWRYWGVDFRYFDSYRVERALDQVRA